MPSASNGKVTHEQPFPSCSFTLQELHYTGLSSSLQYQLATSSCIREEYKQWILSFLNTEPLVCPSVHRFIYGTPTLPPLNLKIMVIINTRKMMALCMWLTSSSLPLFSSILLPPLQHPPPAPQSVPSVHLACMPGGLLLTCHRHSHHCRPHRENSPPRGYPARAERKKASNHSPIALHYIQKKSNKEITVAKKRHNLSFYTDSSTSSYQNIYRNSLYVQLNL